jgi:hypothetical protein
MNSAFLAFHGRKPLPLVSEIDFRFTVANKPSGKSFEKHSGRKFSLSMNKPPPIADCGFGKTLFWLFLTAYSELLTPHSELPV